MSLWPKIVIYLVVIHIRLSYRSSFTEDQAITEAVSLWKKIGRETI